MHFKTKLSGLVAASALAVIAVIPAAAALSYTLFGDASVVPGGNPGNAAELRSTSTAPGYGGVDVAGFPADPTQITQLSFDYNPDQTGLSNGSPRMTVSFSDGGSADLRPLALVADTWATVDGMTGTNWDNNGGTCGYVYATDWTTVLGCHAGATIDAIQVINDSGWAYPATGLVTLVDNIRVNADVITFDAATATDKESCKKGGWQSLVREDGSTFKNQGDCVSYTNNGK